MRRLGLSYRKALFRSLACLLGGLATFVSSPARTGETGTWTDQISGTIHIPNLGAVQYTVGYSSVGYDHFRSEIAAEWHDGDDRTQTIYDGIYDNPPAKVWGTLGHLCISMETCVRYEDACSTHVMAYRYDVETKSFAEIEGGERICRP